jgi:hypothetical protein
MQESPRRAIRHGKFRAAFVSSDGAGMVIGL